jgi:hypothetical protein
MDTPTHGFIGGVMMALPVSPFVPWWLVMLMFIYGFIPAILPDLLDWYVWKFYDTPRWRLYYILHNFPPWWLAIFPTYWVHIVLDKPFHEKPSDVSANDWANNTNNIRNWWPRFYPYCILYWVLAIGGFILTFFSSITWTIILAWYASLFLITMGLYKEQI